MCTQNAVALFKRVEEQLHSLELLTAAVVPLFSTLMFNGNPTERGRWRTWRALDFEHTLPLGGWSLWMNGISLQWYWWIWVFPFVCLPVCYLEKVFHRPVSRAVFIGSELIFETRERRKYLVENVKDNKKISKQISVHQRLCIIEMLSKCQAMCASKNSLNSHTVMCFETVGFSKE